MSVPFLRKTLRGLGVAMDDIDDVLQNVLIGAYRGLERYDESRFRDPLSEADEEVAVDEDEEEAASGAMLPWLIESPRELRPLHSWLFGIAWRQVSHYKERAYRRREVPVGLYGNRAFAGIYENPDPEQQMAADQRARLLDALLAGIDPQRRVVLMMHDMLQIPVVDIARELQINENTAQNRLRLAREDFRAAVKRLNPEKRRALRLGDRPFAKEDRTPHRPAPRKPKPT